MVFMIEENFENYSTDPNDRFCSQVDCGRVRIARGLCRGHWKMLRAGEPLREIRKRGVSKWINEDGTPKPCQWQECNEAIDTGGLCKYHYQHWHYQVNRGRDKAHKNVKKTDPITGLPLPCRYPGCGGRIHYAGYCPGHIQMVREGRELRPLRHRIPCAVMGCPKDMLWSSEACTAHVSTATRHGLSNAELVGLFRSHDGKCGNPNCDSREGLQVDHDHICCAGSKSCGKCIRGLLCGPCNRSLGLAQDSPQKLRGLVEYLEGK